MRDYSLFTGNTDNVVNVHQGAGGSNDGTSYANAYETITAAVDDLQGQTTPGGIVVLHPGTYTDVDVDINCDVDFVGLSRTHSRWVADDPTMTTGVLWWDNNYTTYPFMRHSTFSNMAFGARNVDCTSATKCVLKTQSGLVKHLPSLLFDSCDLFAKYKTACNIDALQFIQSASSGIVEGGSLVFRNCVIDVDDYLLYLVSLTKPMSVIFDRCTLILNNLCHTEAITESRGVLVTSATSRFAISFLDCNIFVKYSTSNTYQTTLTGMSFGGVETNPSHLYMKNTRIIVSDISGGNVTTIKALKLYNMFAVLDGVEIIVPSVTNRYAISIETESTPVSQVYMNNCYINPDHLYDANDPTNAKFIQAAYLSELMNADLSGYNLSGTLPRYLKIAASKR